ncbi:MAG: DNA repair protein RadA [Flavobacteriaceae bacterium]|nr:DNA repair protein RadA [Flavobacteriaceae bacterium]
MAKVKKKFSCQSCGVVHPTWNGQCNVCKQWNTIVEEIIERPDAREWKQDTGIVKTNNSALRISEIHKLVDKRISTNNNELDNVLGGGIVLGSVILLGGEPGVGKSTLLLQIAISVGKKVLYVSGEESQSQIKLRADRILGSNEDCYVLTETNTQKIFKTIEEIKPEILVIDSIQTLHTSHIDATPGTVSQIRESAAELIKFAKETSTPIFIIGHINKEGTIAGPKILEHMVDVVLQFEGERKQMYRILRSSKNRFGSTSEIGIFQMQGDGLREVTNPSELLISEKEEGLSGTAIASTLEGVRPLLVEVQSLVSPAVYGTPQRSCTGFDTKRLNMILAVLEKRAGFKLGTKDVFLNITGGIKVDDPAIDLAVATAILSSNINIGIEQNYCFAAELGLSGEIRPVQRVDQRILEASKLGYKKIFVSKFNKITNRKSDIKIIEIGKIEDVIMELFVD